MVVLRFLIRCGFGNRQYMQFDRKNNRNDSFFEIQSKNNKKVLLIQEKNPCNTIIWCNKN